MNRNEVRKVISRFNTNANRLLQSDYDDYIDTLKKFIGYIDSTELIKDYIDSCGAGQQDMKKEFDEILHSNGELTFTIGYTVEEEVCNTYDMLKYLSENYQFVPQGVLFLYSRASSFAKCLKAFNDKFVMVLIRHIDSFLKDVGIDMGLDDKIVYNINPGNGQVNIANDSSTINAVQNNGLNADELSRLISELRNALDPDLSDEEREEANDSIDIIEKELKSDNPDEKNIKTHFKFLKRINKGLDTGTKLANTCLALAAFAEKVYPFFSQIPSWLGLT